MFWGIELEPEKPQTLTPKYPLHITKCILGSSNTAEEDNTKARNVVKCQSGEEKESSYVIASLRLGVKEQTSLDLVFEPEVPIVLSTTGPSKVNLVGFYITTFDHDEEDEEEEDFDVEEEEEEEEEEDEKEKKDALKALLGDEELEDDEEDFDPNENEKENKEQHMRDIIDDKIFKSELKAEKRQLKKDLIEKEEKEEEEKEVVVKPAKKAQKVEKEGKPQKVATKEPEKKALPSEPKKQQQKTLEPQKFANGLIVQDIVVGSGAKPVRGHKIVMNYVGRLKNGKVFDKSTRANPFSFKFGVGQVIKGWDIGINGMQVGGKRKLTIPPSLGYGNQRVGPIPANSTLIFDVELIAVK